MWFMRNKEWSICSTEPYIFITKLNIVNIVTAIETVAASMWYIKMDPHPNYQIERTLICRGSVSSVENSLSGTGQAGSFLITEAVTILYYGLLWTQLFVAVHSRGFTEMSTRTVPSSHRGVKFFFSLLAVIGINKPRLRVLHNLLWKQPGPL